MLKTVLYQTIYSREETKAVVTVLKARGKRALYDVNCFCKMMPVMALNILKVKYSLLSIPRISRD